METNEAKDMKDDDAENRKPFNSNILKKKIEFIDDGATTLDM